MACEMTNYPGAFATYQYSSSIVAAAVKQLTAVPPLFVTFLTPVAFPLPLRSRSYGRPSKKKRFGTTERF